MNCKIRNSKLNVLQAGGLLLARRSQRLRRAEENSYSIDIQILTDYFNS
jgi:hypothetical protein